MIEKDVGFAGSVDEVFTRFDKPGSPGAAVALIADGQVIFKNGYGYADLEHQVPITPSTIFNIGSDAKQFTAMAILLLEQEGKLSLADAIQIHIPELHDFGEPVTLDHLLHHTSGLRDLIPLTVLAGWREGDVTTNSDVIRLVAGQKELNFPPGQEFDYSNTGYLLLAKVVEKCSGISFAQFCNDRIFQPLGMVNSFVHDDYTMLIPNRARGYYYDEDREIYVNALLADTVLGSTNIYADVMDMALWDENFYSHSVGGKSAIGKMHKPGRLNDGRELDYGLGLFLGHSYQGLKIVEHGGGHGGYGCRLIRFPDLHFSVIVMANLFMWDLNEYALRAADVYLGEQVIGNGHFVSAAGVREPTYLELSESQLKKFVGTYLNRPRAAIRRVEYRKGSLALFGMNLIPTTESEFFLEDEPGVIITFAAPEDGSAAQLWIDSGSTNFCYEQVEVLELSTHELQTYSGRYFCPELDLEWMITYMGDQLMVRRKKYDDTYLKPLFKDAFEDNWLTFTFWPESGLMLFQRGRTEEIVGFKLSCDRIRNMWFVRLNEN